MEGTAHRNLKRRLRKHKSEADRISQLPIDILLQIFFFLPLNSWAAMSMVSRWFRHLLTHVPVLDFSEQKMIEKAIRNHNSHPLCDGNSGDHLSLGCYLRVVQESRTRFTRLVNQILHSHSGFTMKKFHLSINYDQVNWDVSNINSWVSFAFTRNIEEVKLSFGEGTLLSNYMSNGLRVSQTGMACLYAFPCQIFAPKTLTSLTLTSCQFKAYGLGTFGSLRWLNLINAELLDNTIGDLLSKFPVLHSLSMENCVIEKNFMVCEEWLMIKGLSLMNCLTRESMTFPINITAPCLCVFFFLGTCLEDSSIARANLLQSVQVDIKYTSADHSQGNFLSSLLNSLTSCQWLSLSSWCIQVLSTRECSPWEYLLQLRSVKRLRLHVSLIKQELPGISCLLRSCTRLDKLTLDISVVAAVESVTWEGFVPNTFNFHPHSYWESQDMSFGCLQSSLKKIRISGFRGRTMELEIIKFFLKNAKVLESLRISDFKNGADDPVNRGERASYSSDIKCSVMNFHRASPHARIVMEK